MKNNKPITIAIGLLLLVLFGSVLFVFQVRNTEVAIKTTFGKPSSNAVSEPGAYLRLPWPIQKIYRFDKRIQNLEDKFEESTTRDSFNLLVEVFAGWRIDKPDVFLPKFPDASIAEAERQLRDQVRSAKRSVIGQYEFADLISTDESKLKLQEIETRILDQVRKGTEEKYGIRFEFLGIRRLGVPESISEKVISRMESERQRLIEQIEGEGEEEAQKIRSEADKQTGILLAQAEAERKRLLGEGEAEAAQYYEVFERNPELARFLLKLEAFRQSLSDQTTLILDPTTPPFDMLDPVQSEKTRKAIAEGQVDAQSGKSPK